MLYPLSYGGEAAILAYSCRKMDGMAEIAREVRVKTLILLMLAVPALVLLGSRAARGETPKTGQAAPAFVLQDQAGRRHALSDHAGSWLVLYFYPKDDTPGCTRQACSFRDDLTQLEKLGARVVGVSVDDSASHARFAQKYNLPFPLLADRDGAVAKRYGALTDLGLVRYAKRYTFLIDPRGIIARTYLSVDTSRHSQDIIDDLRVLVGQPRP